MRMVHFWALDHQLQLGVSMRHLELHPEDAQWLRRWLCSNLVCCFAICGFLLLVGFQSDRPGELQARTGVRLQAEEQTLRQAVAFSDDLQDRAIGADLLQPNSELALLSGQHPNPVAPEGWRRTSEGWEHVSTWQPIARPLGEIVMEQKAREPIWIRAGLAKVRDVPPLAFALLQIAAISAIVGLSRTERREDLKRVAAVS
jgi:hypothetical protein